MRCVLQRVRKASVEIDGEICGSINKGIVVLCGVCDDDDDRDVEWMADKVTGLRIFCDENDKMNLALSEVGGEIMIISQFTLYGNCKKGKRPNFTAAGKPEYAEKVYNQFVESCGKRIKNVQTGRFGADMLVSLENDGPVTLIIDSKE